MESGQKVTFLTEFRKERGVVKGLCDDEDYVFVVYNCGGNWGNYENYTAEKTRVDDLKLGWK